MFKVSITPLIFFLLITLPFTFEFQNLQSFSQKFEFLREHKSAVSTKCASDLLKMRPQGGSPPYQIYAIGMIDSIGKTPSGLFKGNFNSFGYYKECLDTPEDFAHYALVQLSISMDPSQLWSLDSLSLNQLNISKLKEFSKGWEIENGEENNGVEENSTSSLTFSFRHGICTPKSCDEDDITSIYPFLFLHFLFPTSNVNSTIYDVEIASTSSFDTFAVFVVIILSFFLFFTFLGTSIDYFQFSVVLNTLLYHEQPPQSNSDESVYASSIENQIVGETNQSSQNNLSGYMINTESMGRVTNENSLLLDGERDEESILISFLKCWSLKRNATRLFSTKRKENKIYCLDGIRVLSLFWVILGHTYYFGAGFIDNPSELYNITKRFSFLTVSNGFFSVDSFFFLSGFLVSYISVKHRENPSIKNFSFYSYLYYIWHRFWRLTPTYMIAILIYWRLERFWGDGPVWWTQQENENCDKYWWTNILYINNFYPTTGIDMCMGWSWYLPNDFQFYLVTPLFFLLWINQREITCGVLWFLSMIGTLTTTYVLTVYYHLNAYFIIPSENDSYSIDYIKPYTRAAPYLVGVMLAFILNSRDHSTHVRSLSFSFSSSGRFQLSPIVLRIGHVLASGMIISSVYSLYPESSGDTVWSDTENAFYKSLSRLGWSLGLAWIVFVCAIGEGGFVNKILSLSIWQPLSALSYCAYLLHPILFLIFYQNLQNSAWHVDDILYPVFFVSAICFTIACSVLLHLTVEVPFANLGPVFKRLYIKFTQREYFREF